VSNLHRRSVLLGMAAGAAAAFFLDPQTGRRHRALARDKARRYARRMPGATARAARRLTGPTRGIARAMARRMPGYVAPAVPDRDQFIKERVQSELGHVPGLPLDALNFDAIDGVVRVRGTVPDVATAHEILEQVIKVEGVRAAESRMFTPDGAPIGSTVGDVQVVTGAPRAAIYGEALRRSLIERWPVLMDDDIEASGGHIGRLVTTISERSGEPERDVRAALDAMVEVVV
jgi:hypothetical protein